MKKQLSSIIALMLCAFAMQAQTQSLGVQLGFSEPIFRQNTHENTKKLSDKTTADGFKVGLVYDATLIKGFGMSIALNYAFAADAGKWDVVNSQYTAQQQRTSIITHTLELPIDWQYKIRIAYDTWVIVYTGPTLQYNVSYTSQIKYKGYQKKDPENINHYKIDGDNDGKTDYTPFNIQWGVGAGFQYKNYYIRGGYNFGIYNHFRDTYNDKAEYTNRARADEWNIRLGIYFLNF